MQMKDEKPEIDMIPVVTANGQVEWFSLVMEQRDGKRVPALENVSRYGGDLPVYFDTTVRRLRLTPKAEEAGWVFYDDLCKQDRKDGEKWLKLAHEKIKPMVKEPNKYQVTAFAPELHYHPEVIERRKQFDTSGARVLDWGDPSKKAEAKEAKP